MTLEQRPDCKLVVLRRKAHVIHVSKTYVRCHAYNTHNKSMRHTHARTHAINGSMTVPQNYSRRRENWILQSVKE